MGRGTRDCVDLDGHPLVRQELVKVEGALGRRLTHPTPGGAAVPGRRLMHILSRLWPPHHGLVVQDRLGLLDSR